MAKTKNFFSSCFALFVIFGINISQLWFLKYLLPLLGVLTLFDSSFVKKTSILKNKFINIICLLFIILFLATASPIINRTFQYSYTLEIIQLFGRCFSCIFLIYTLHKLYGDKLTLSLFFKIFVNACVIYVFTSFLFILFPEIKNFWYENFLILTADNSVAAAKDGAYAYRTGIGGWSGFGCATIFSIALLMNTYLLLKNENPKKFKYGIFAQAMIVSGCFLYARSTIVAFALCLIYIIAFLFKNRKALRIILTLTVILLIALVVIFTLAQTNKNLETWVSWAFSVISDVIQGNKISDTSVNHLFNDMYFMPSFKTLLFGDGYYMSPDENSYYMHTDVGFMRLILFFGIFGLMTMYITFIQVSLLTAKQFKVEKDKEGQILIWFIIILIFIFEFKGETITEKISFMTMVFFAKQIELYYKNISIRRYFRFYLKSFKGKAVCNQK